MKPGTVSSERRRAVRASGRRGRLWRPGRPALSAINVRPAYQLNGLNAFKPRVAWLRTHAAAGPWHTDRMRTDGPRVALLSAIGIPIAVVAAIDPPDSQGPELAFAFMLAVSLSAVVWLAVSSWLVGRASWLAIGVAGLAAFGLSLSARHGSLMATALAGIFWWLAGVLLVLPAGQAIRAIQRARRAIRQAPHGQGANGIESQQ
jgi:hypothetical protein